MWAPHCGEGVTATADTADTAGTADSSLGPGASWGGQAGSCTGVQLREGRPPLTLCKLYHDTTIQEKYAKY